MVGDRLKGCDGEFTFDGGVVAECTSWSTDITSSTQEVTPMGDGCWQEFDTTVKGWTGAANLSFNYDTDQAGLIAALIAGVKVPVILRAGKTAAGEGVTFTGDVFVTATGLTNDATAISALAVTMQGTGPLVPAATA